MKRAVLAVVLAAVVAVAGYGAWRYAAGLGPRRVAGEYVASLARGDPKSAKNLSVGSAAFAATRLEGLNAKAEVQKVRAFLAVLGSGWAVVGVEAELVLADGTADVGWYEVELVRDGGSWKVAALREAPPFVSGVGLPARGKDAEEAKAVFQEYLSLLSQGRYAEAARLCVGPARTAQEKQAPVLGSAPIFKEVGRVSSKPLWRRGRYLALFASYGADGRQVKTVVLMYRTFQGWRIIRADQA